ncbi:MAG: hypothetical protein O3B84_03220 [Chloroflexi bacterium]|nr:hypothetical protein [Chloroflexota bacterium]
MAISGTAGLKSEVGALVRGWDWALYALIFAYIALPQFYRSSSIFLIGSVMPDSGALATVAQWGFVELVLEVIQETFVLAIFFFVGRSATGGYDTGEAIRTVLTILLIASLLVAAILFAASGLFVQVIGTPEQIRDLTATFLRIKSAAIPLALISAALVVMVETTNRKRKILLLALLNVAFRFLLDSLFYGGYAFSLNLGVIGVAWSDAAANALLLITTLLMLRESIVPNLNRIVGFFTFRGWKTYLGVSTGSGLDSLVRNLAYFFLIVRMLDLIGEEAIAGYYLAMHIFWSFLLVPVLALSETAKVLIGNHAGDLPRVRRLWASSLLVCLMLVVVWVLLLPWGRNFAGLLNDD